MTAIVRIASPSGWTDVDESDLPLAIGISADGAAVFGSDAEANAGILPGPSHVEGLAKGLHRHGIHQQMKDANR